jgi:hypothetical protein
VCGGDFCVGRTWLADGAGAETDGQKRGYEFNFSTVSRQDEGTNSTFRMMSTDRHRVELTMEFVDGQTSRGTLYGQTSR